MRISFYRCLHSHFTLPPTCAYRITINHRELVFEENKFHRKSLSLQHLPNGIYYITVRWKGYDETTLIFYNT